MAQAHDHRAGQFHGFDAPYLNAAAVTPHDTNELADVTDALFVGSAGSVKVKMRGGQTVTFGAVPAGTTIRVRVEQVFAIGTSASNIVALW